MIIKPWGYSLWHNIQTYLDKIIADQGFENVYFPLLIPLSLLQKEASHIDGFAKECAVVTHSKLSTDNSGALYPDAILEQPYIIRPTSEAIIGEAFSKWIQSYRQLPLKINQWANIVRWEMRTRLFLRTTEFLWQEGHAAFATSDQAIYSAQKMTYLYYKFCKEHLAMPCIVGAKTPLERFPGAKITYTLEAMMQDHKALQSATSHFLDDYFAKAYNITYQNDQSNHDQYVYTTSFGMSTRIIGALIMTHGDDFGMVVPPKISPIHVEIVPFLTNQQNNFCQNDHQIIELCNNIKSQLSKITYHQDHVKVKVNLKNLSFSHRKWSAIKKGVPLLIEIGKKELDSNTLSLRTRWNLTKDSLPIKTSLEKLKQNIVKILDQGQSYIYNKALDMIKSHTEIVYDIEQFNQFFKDNAPNKFIIAPCDPDFDQSSVLSQLKISQRCIIKNNHQALDQSSVNLQKQPDNIFHHDELINDLILKDYRVDQNQKCIFSNQPAKDLVVYGKSY